MQACIRTYISMHALHVNTNIYTYDIPKMHKICNQNVIHVCLYIYVYYIIINIMLYNDASYQLYRLTSEKRYFSAIGSVICFSFSTG